jgi:hypothetical protein
MMGVAAGISRGRLVDVGVGPAAGGVGVAEATTGVRVGLGVAERMIVGTTVDVPVAGIEVAVTIAITVEV